MGACARSCHAGRFAPGGRRTSGSKAASAWASSAGPSEARSRGCRSISTSTTSAPWGARRCCGRSPRWSAPSACPPRAIARAGERRESGHRSTASRKTAFGISRTVDWLAACAGRRVASQLAPRRCQWPRSRRRSPIRIGRAWYRTRRGAVEPGSECRPDDRPAARVHLAPGDRAARGPGPGRGGPGTRGLTPPRLLLLAGKGGSGDRPRGPLPRAALEPASTGLAAGPETGRVAAASRQWR